MDRNNWSKKLSKADAKYHFPDGYKLLYSPWETLKKAKIAFISLNPGKPPKNAELKVVSDERGNSYEVEKEITESEITHQFLSLCKFLETSPNEVLTGTICPFRSADWENFLDGSTFTDEQKRIGLSLGEEFWIWLQLKVIADIGIIGLPNSGKSSLLASLTRAKPKVANYPFTTLNPNLGVFRFNNKEVTLADIPGLVEGAHKGVGLGDKFLRHIERCKALLHLIDINEIDLIKNYKKIRNELKAYDNSLIKKREILILNKSDLVESNVIKKKQKEFKEFVKKKFDIISLFNKRDIEKLKKILIKNATQKL